jgi:hypothetical protein
MRILFANALVDTWDPSAIRARLALLPLNIKMKLISPPARPVQAVRKAMRKELGQTRSVKTPNANVLKLYRTHVSIQRIVQNKATMTTSAAYSATTGIYSLPPWISPAKHLVEV